MSNQRVAGKPVRWIVWRKNSSPVALGRGELARHQQTHDARLLLGRRATSRKVFAGAANGASRRWNMKAI